MTTIQTICAWALPIIFAITVHEAAHGYAAKLLGDKTAYLLGRVTLNPLKHLDPVGSVIVPLILLILGGIVLGWAKPVPVTGANFKHPRRDFAIVSAAGPIANFAMAILWAAIAKVGVIMVVNQLYGGRALYAMGIAGIVINLMLMLVNLLPVPPLDGGHILASLLPKSWSRVYSKLEPFGLIIILLLLWLGVLARLLRPLMLFLLRFITEVLFQLPRW